MSESRFEGVTAFPRTVEMEERFLLQRIESVQTLDELIGILEELNTIKSKDKSHDYEEILVTLGELDSLLDNMKSVGQSTACDLVEFPVTYGLRRTVGRLFRAKGYEVHDSALAETEQKS
jgi:hypothetical protein